MPSSSTSRAHSLAMLLRSLRRYELHHDEQGEQEMCPSASLVNQFELEFLRELCDLTLRAMRKETGLAELFGDEEGTWAPHQLG